MLSQLSLGEPGQPQDWSRNELDELYKFAYDKIIEGNTAYTVFFYYNENETNTFDKFKDENAAGIYQEFLFISPHSNSDVCPKPLSDTKFITLVKEISSRFPSKLFISYFTSSYRFFKQYALCGKTYIEEPTYPDFSAEKLNQRWKEFQRF